ncbi:MAG: DUF2914 domain-containing protein [Proteobacteria bacterium]|nr:DUF2914 domain-containing protein [Pseudomonadota bacterium]MBU1709123.1 DUF2914 domain-containing protein [Pseudomonadota bacterium]
MKKVLNVIAALSVMVLLGITVNSAFAQDAPGFTVARMVVCEDVADREPVGAGETFPLSLGAVYGYLEAKDIDADTEIRFVWMHNDIQTAVVPLTIRKGNRWRTYSSKKLGNRTGAWKVELQDTEGTVLKTVAFTVE